MRRGAADPDAAERYLVPSLEQLHDPFLLFGMDPAVDRLLAARERGEKVAIVGDYDVDGVSATAQLLAVFSARGLAAQAILPHRMRDGYGFQAAHVERARAAGCGLILTADCGSSSASAIEAAREQGIDVVVTDHHLPGGDLPAGTIQINPRQADCLYPYPDLAAAGIALKLSAAFAARLGRPVGLEPLLRIACLGTIADLVPLTGENRVIAALGLAAFERTRSVGLKALLRQAGLKTPIRSSDVGFRIGPRLNAAGRLDDPTIALDLLLEKDEGRAAEQARTLDELNRDRQREEARVVEEADAEVRARLDATGALPPIVVLWSEGWHRGVVGIAAGRIARQWQRPTLLLAVEGGQALGSGRSVPGLSLHGFLAPWQERLIRFGGHAQALGMTVDLAELPGLRAEWEEAARAWPEELLERRHSYELDVPARALDMGFLTMLRRLEPFGQGNREPVLRVGPLELSAPVRRFGERHLSARARGVDGGAIDLVGWGLGDRADEFGGRFEALGCLEFDDYRGAPVLRLIDVHATIR